MLSCFDADFRKKLIRGMSRPITVNVTPSILSSVIPVSRPAIPRRIPPPISSKVAITTGYLANTFKNIPILNFHNPCQTKTVKLYFQFKMVEWVY